jgi:hypothetical protein
MGSISSVRRLPTGSVTGGEPLDHPDFEMVLDRLGDYRFRSILLATNGSSVERCLESVVTRTDYLVVSLDTLDEAKGDRLAGCASGTAARVLANIERLARHPGPRCHMTISAVVTPVVSPLGDVYYPCLEGGRVAGNLLQEPDLHRLRQKGMAQQGGDPGCRDQCHSACMVSASLLIQHPGDLLGEAWRRIRGARGAAET